MNRKKANFVRRKDTEVESKYYKRKEKERWRVTLRKNERKKNGNVGIKKITERIF